MTAAEPVAEWVITVPGSYDGMPNAVYHGDPVPGGSLSCSGARRLLPPSTPAAYRWYVENGEAPKRIYDFGHVAHSKILGIGDPVVVVDADSWRTNKAKAQRDQAYAAGHIPILAEEAEQVDAMAEALAKHPVASALLLEPGGQSEQSLFWQDEQTGVWLRARLDRIRAQRDGRPVIPDYKTTEHADADAFGKAMANLGYHQQAPWYCDAVKAVGLAGDEEPAFVFVVQERVPPYLIAIRQPDPIAMRIGRERNRKAIGVYRDCAASEVWPGYSSEVEAAALPGWAEYQHNAAVERGEFEVTR